MNCCFIGHKTIKRTNTLISSLRETVSFLIENGVTSFLFGSASEFDTLALEIVSELKKLYPFIKRVYVRSSCSKISKSYKDFLLESYENTYFPTKLENAGRCSYVERNYEMINLSSYCVFYYDENYEPAPTNKAKKKLLLPKARKSGTKIAYEYAKKKKKEIINLFK